MSATSLSLALRDGGAVGPTDIALTLDDATPRAGPGGSLTVGAADLRALAAIAAHVPLPDAVRRDVARLAPQGIVRNARLQWTGDPATPERFALQADVQGFSVAPEDGLPGVTHLTGSVDMNEGGGRLRISGAATTLALPRIFAEPLAFDRLEGDVRWQVTHGATEIDWRDVAFANADLAGTTAGSWQSRLESAGVVDVTARVTRANLAATHRYVPLATPAPLRGWLRRAMVKGASVDAQLALSGDLAAFPYGSGKEGRFELAVKARNATLDYADRWTPITGIDADFRMDGPRIVVDATAGQMNGVAIGATHAEIADVRDANATLRVDGTASGPLDRFLAFVATSPVADWLAHATDDMAASGDGRLALKFALPLHDHSKATVAGDFRIVAPAVEIAGLPALSGVDGDIVFSEHDVHATNIAAQALGGPLALTLASEGGHLRVGARGSADLALVRKAFDIPVLAHMSGTSDWQLALDAADGDTTWNVQSSLAGVAIDLPAPIGKAADAAAPVRIERHPAKLSQDVISIDYGGIARVLLHRQAKGNARSVDRALVLLGKSIGGTTDATQPGLWIRADVPALDVDAWLDVGLASSTVGGSGDGESLAVNGIDVAGTSVVALGRSFANVKASARRDKGDWRLSFAGDEIAGSATWRAATPEEPGGRIVARLARFTVPPEAEGSHAAAGATSPRANRWPAVDLVADSIVKKGRPLGKLELVGQPSGADWQIRKLALVNEAGRIDAQGTWRDAAADPKTQLAVTLDVREAGAFLGRFGWTDAVKGAPTKIEGQVSWTGSPSDFDYPSLAGRLTLHTGAGQFTKLEPGVGRLLGILSLQALPRRISLDFRDVFSEGFAFDSIVGDVRIHDGVMHSDNLRLAGPAAAVDIAGDVDLTHETQALDVRVHPSLSTGVSAGAAALFLANPLVGAAVGAGTLLAQKMLNNPFDQLFTYRYVVTGTFDDPVVTRGGARAANDEAASTAR